MTVNIEKMRFDMATEQTKLARDTRRFFITTTLSAILATAAAVGAGVGLGNLIWAHREPPPPIVIQLAAPSK